MKESVIAMNTPINHLTAGFIGLGLIGGSIARGLKRSAPDIQIMALCGPAKNWNRHMQTALLT